MGHGALRTTGRTRSLESPGKAILLPLLVPLLFLLCLVGAGEACIARYDVVSGSDNLGNEVSGSLYIESAPSFGFSLGFDIVGYGFHSEAVDYSGSERSFIVFWPGAWIHGASEVLAGLSWIQMGEWGNFLGGVFFFDEVMGDVEATRENYSTLHEYLQIDRLNWSWDFLGRPGPHGVGKFVFRLAHGDPPAQTPAPSALLLFAPGLAGLAFLRRRFFAGAGLRAPLLCRRRA
jgi:hypothetical protein